GYDGAMPVQGDEDWDLWLTLVERWHRGVLLPEVMFNYRRRAGSMSTVCWLGFGHLPLANYRVAKHQDTYRAYLTEVLLHQDQDTAVLLRKNDELERYLASDLEPAVALRRDELAMLRSRLASASATSDESKPETSESRTIDRTAELEAGIQTLSAEVTALKVSMSWRVTAPLRSIYGRWLRWRGQQ